MSNTINEKKLKDETNLHIVENNPQNAIGSSLPSWMRWKVFIFYLFIYPSFWIYLKQINNSGYIFLYGHKDDKTKNKYKEGNTPKNPCFLLYFF